MSIWRKAMFGLALICGSGIAPTAWADAEEDYKAGYEAYRKGDMGGAMKNLEKAAAANHVRAQALLGQLLDVADNNAQAMKYYRMAADQGDAEAMFGMGVMYRSGDGIEKNEKEGLDWIRKAAEKGYPPAVAAMAGYYLAGAKGGAGLDEQGRAEAKRWITGAAEQDNLPAMRAMIDGFKTGKYGFAQDPAQAAAWEAKLKAKQKPAAKAEDK
jgi:TPR repeat protein